MLLTADIGNSTINLGVFDKDTLIQSWSLSCFDNNFMDTLKDFNITSAVVCSVVPSVSENFISAMKIPVLTVTSKTHTGIILDVENPETVGSDRIANACAVYNLYKTPAVAVDFGTATNFDVVTEDRRFIGGIITSGIKTSAKALTSSTALLPEVNIEDIDNIIGNNTTKSIQSGLIIGHSAMIDGLLDRIETELGTSVTTIATGGLAQLVTRHMKRQFDHINPHLTLEGLRIIHGMNSSLL